MCPTIPSRRVPMHGNMLRIKPQPSGMASPRGTPALNETNALRETRGPQSPVARQALPGRCVPTHP